MTPWTTTSHGLCELPSNSFPESNIESGPQVLLIYEDLEFVLRAMRLLGSILKSTDIDEAHLSTWQFDHLQSADARRKASARAQSADIVIISLKAGHGLPSQVRSWFDEWIRSRNVHDGALVAIFEPDNGMECRPSGTGSLLQAVAITAGMDYFSNAPKRSSHRVIHPTLASPEMSERSPTSRWGRNE